MSNSHSEFTMYKTEFLISPKPALPAVFPISANGYTSLIHMFRSKALESTLTPLSLTYSIQLTTTLIIIAANTYSKVLTMCQAMF